MLIQKKPISKIFQYSATCKNETGYLKYAYQLCQVATIFYGGLFLHDDKLIIFNKFLHLTCVQIKKENKQLLHISITHDILERETHHRKRSLLSHFRADHLPNYLLLPASSLVLVEEDGNEVNKHCNCLSLDDSPAACQKPSGIDTI